MSTATGKLRIVVITEDDPIYVYRFFETFFAEAPRDRVEIAGVTVARAFHEPLHRTALRMMRFYGPVGFTRLTGKYLGARLRRRSIGGLARAAGIPELPTASVNDPAYVERLRHLRPDVIVSVAAPEIFRRDLLSVPELGCVNIHSGRLPRYRGMMPTFWQLLHGEEHATVTVHEMVEQLDAGRVLATLDFPLRRKDTLDRVIRETKIEGARLMIRVLEQIRTGTTEPVTLDMSAAGYFSFPKPGDVQTFRARGHRLV